MGEIVLKNTSAASYSGYHAYYDIPSTTTEVKDALGRVISVTDKDGKTTYYEYDADSNLIRTTDPNGAVSTSQYDVLGRQVVSSDFEGNITRYEYDVMGRTTKSTGPDGSSTRFEYDAKGRQTRTIYSDDTYTQTTYDIYGNTKTTRDRAGRVTEFFYDKLNRTVKIKDPAGNYTYYQYDANGNRTAVRDPRSSGAAADTYKTSYTYDLNNRLTRIDYPNGTYETTTYDPNGNTLTKTDQKGQTTTYQYDNNNRTTKIIHPDQTTTEYAFDAAGRMIGRKYPDGSSTYYETLGNPVESHLSREYKIAGDGSLIYDYYSEFDSIGRLIKFLDSTEAAIVKFNNVKYNETINKIGYTPASTLGHHFTYGRQTEGGVPHRTYRQGTPEDPRIAWGKIKFGTRGIQYASAPGVLITSYSYDDNNAMSMTDPFGKTYRLESTGDTNRLYYPNGTYTEKHFNRFGIADTITIKRTESDGSETVLESIAYQFDTVGNITKKTFLNGEYLQYSYDSMGRLTAEERKTASDGRIYKIEYLYDNVQSRIGNMHKVIVNETDITTFDYNEMSELISVIHPDSSVETLTYDDNGNLIQSVNRHIKVIYEWDNLDRLRNVKIQRTGDATIVDIFSFGYDSDNRLIEVDYPFMNVTFKNSNERCIRQNIFPKHSTIDNTSNEGHTIINDFFLGQLVCIYNNKVDSTGICREFNEGFIETYYYNDLEGMIALTVDSSGHIKSKTFTDFYSNPLPEEEGENILLDGNFAAKTLHNEGLVLNEQRTSFRRLDLEGFGWNYLMIALNKSDKSNQLANLLYHNKPLTIFRNGSGILKGNYNQQIFTLNSDILRSQNIPQQTHLWSILNKAMEFCPKINSVIKEMKLRGFGKELYFAIEDATGNHVGIGNPMSTGTNKFRYPFHPGPPFPQIVFIYIDYWKQSVNNKISIDYMASMMVHEFVHIQDNRNWNQKDFEDDFFTRFSKSEDTCKGTDGSSYLKSEIISEFHAYKISYLLYTKLNMQKEAKDAEQNYQYFKQILKDPNCCIKQGYMKEATWSDYCT